MNAARALPGSFRDPSGYVYELDGRILRTVTDRFAGEFRFVDSTGLLQKLVADGALLPFENVDSKVLGLISDDVQCVLEVPRLKLVSFPYEWSFPALKAAALLHLEIQLRALEYGVTLTDASAYNVQFQGARPIFIDHLSFRRYRPGEIWVGHRQFCEQFLNPLLLRSFFGIPHNSWYRGTQEGLPAVDFCRLLKWRHFLSWNVLTHVVLQSHFQHSATNNTVDLEKGKLPISALPADAYKRIVKKLQTWIEKLEPADTGKTIWRDYSKTNSYSSEEMQNKKRFVGEFVAKVKPSLLWDLGCNSGDYSICALEAGADYVVGFDFDQGALEAAFARAYSRDLPFQTLFLDAANPAPSQGWREQERPGLRGRVSADALLALAFIHHLAIARNIPLDQLLDWIIGLAPRGVIEFVPKADPMVKNLLRLRDDIFTNYTKECFLAEISRRATVVRSEVISSTGRLLAWYERR